MEALRASLERKSAAPAKPAGRCRGTQAAQAGASRAGRGGPGCAQGREEQGLADRRLPLDASLWRPRRRAAAARFARHAACARRRGLRDAGARPAQRWRFSFQDLIVLRTAQALADAHVPQRRITRSVRELRRHLPESMPLSGLAIGAVADRVVVREGRSALAGGLGPVPARVRGRSRRRLAHRDRARRARAACPGAWSARDWFDRGARARSEGCRGGDAGVPQAIEADAANLDARINLGWLLHEAKRLPDADASIRTRCRRAVKMPSCSSTSACCSRTWRASPKRSARIAPRSRATRAWPTATTTWRCSTERLGKSKDAIRHMSQYRRLTRPGAA